MIKFTVNIDPITRIEGHLAVRIEVENGRVARAYSAGEMFRGFEAILKGRHPLDAQQITQRICGVCPVSHGIASVLAQDRAYGVRPTENGRLGRNMIQAANFIQSHITHFYQLSIMDFIDVAAVAGYGGNDPGLRELKAWVNAQLSSDAIYPAAPFLPRYEGDYLGDTDANILILKHYLDALKMRAVAHRMGAVLAGKLPHAPGLVPGGITETVTAEKIASVEAMLSRLRAFIDDCYLPDVLQTAAAFPEYFHQGKGYSNFLVFGAYPESDLKSGPKSGPESGPESGTETGSVQAGLFPPGVVMDGKLHPLNVERITEDTGHSYYTSASGMAPGSGRTVPGHGNPDAYSWVKAPRYDGKVMEVGPLARIMVAARGGADSPLKSLTQQALDRLNIGFENLESVMGRHLARALECKVVADRCAAWVEQLVPGRPAFQDFDVSENSRGMGLTEAPRGALGHWISIRKGRIENYQCVVPTTWNCSPRDDRGNPGPVERALVGTPVADEQNPIEAVRVVRSFDPCLACAVH